MPVAGGGVHYTTVYHEKGTGFNMENNTNIAELKKAFQAGFQFCLTLSQSSIILLSSSYNLTFENKRLDFININIGIQTRL